MKVLNNEKIYKKIFYTVIFLGIFLFSISIADIKQKNESLVVTNATVQEI